MRIPYIPKLLQVKAIEHIQEHTRCGLFAGMGTGKTSATIKASLDLDLVRPCFPMLVLAPLRVAISTWPDEVEKWDEFSGLRVACCTGTVTERRAALRLVFSGRAEIMTINYENIPWLIEELAGKWPFKRVTADESTKLRGFRLRQGTMRSGALGRVAHAQINEWLNLTGTPTPNGLQGLWGQTWFIDAGLRLGRSFSAFESRWFQKGYNGFGLTPLPHAHAEIMRLLSDVCLSMMPDNIEQPILNDIYVDLPVKAMASYRELEKTLFTEIEENPIEAFNAAAKSNKCLQLANGAVYSETGKTDWLDVHDAKLQALESIVNDAEGMPVLVAYNFKSDLARILRAFPKARALDDKPQTIRDWNAGKIPMLVVHPASAGHGLNLQDGSNILALFGLNWDLELYMQVIERIGPMRQKQSGHNRPVFIHRIIARDTVDELVIERLDTKKSVQDLVLEALNRRRK